MRHLAAVILGLACLCGTSAHGQVILKPKVEAGTRHAYWISQFVTQTSEGGEHKEESDAGLVISIENGNRNDHGEIRQTVKFESLRNNYEVRRASGSQTLSFDSVADLAKVEPPGDDLRGIGFFLDVFRALLGSSYNVDVDKDNQVVGIQGVDEIIGNAAPSATRWLGGLGSQIRVERLKAGHEQVLKRFPDNALVVGEKWEKTGAVDLYLVGPMIVTERQYEYLGTEERGGRTLDKIGWTDKKIVDRAQPQQTATKSNRPVEKLEKSVIESRGSLYFDRERGLEVESTHFLHQRSKRGEDRVTDLTDLKIETSQKLRE